MCPLPLNRLSGFAGAASSGEQFALFLCLEFDNKSPPSESVSLFPTFNFLAFFFFALATQTNSHLAANSDKIILE